LESNLYIAIPHLPKKNYNMKKGTIILLAIAGALLLLVFNGCGSYNNMVSKQEATSSAWAQVENVYQRRMDLIPNLVNTVKGVANFEQKTLTDVINARASASSIKVDASKLSTEQIQKFQASQGELSQALGRLMVVAEQYPHFGAFGRFGGSVFEQPNAPGMIGLVGIVKRPTDRVSNQWIVSFSIAGGHQRRIKQLTSLIGLVGKQFYMTHAHFYQGGFTGGSQSRYVYFTGLLQTNTRTFIGFQMSLTEPIDHFWIVGCSGQHLFKMSHGRSRTHGM
jgi:hypothetical protein